MNFINSKKITNGINEGNLKVIALVCMFIDHFAVIILKSFLHTHDVYPAIGTVIHADCFLDYFLGYFYEVLRAIGRISYPLFAFMISEGVRHTHSKLKYGLRLLILALVSEIPFNLALNHSIRYTDQQNVFWTLLLGMIAISLASEIEILKERGKIKACLAYAFEAVIIVAACAEGYFIKADYGIAGILTIVVISFVTGGNKLKAGIYALAGAIFTTVLEICTDYSGNYYDYLIKAMLALMIVFVLMTSSVRDDKVKAVGASSLLLATGWMSEMFSILSVPIVMCYNGERGKQNKWFFYLFYPVHLILLVLLCRLLNLW